MEDKPRDFPKDDIAAQVTHLITWMVGDPLQGVNTHPPSKVR